MFKPIGPSGEPARHIQRFSGSQPANGTESKEPFSEAYRRRLRDRGAPLRARASAGELVAIHLEAGGLFHQDRAWTAERERLRSFSGDPAVEADAARQRAELVRSIEDELLIEAHEKRARRLRRSR